MTEIFRKMGNYYPLINLSFENATSIYKLINSQELSTKSTSKADQALAIAKPLAQKVINLFDKPAKQEFNSSNINSSTKSCKFCFLANHSTLVLECPF